MYSSVVLAVWGWRRTFAGWGSAARVRLARFFCVLVALNRRAVAGEQASEEKGVGYAVLVRVSVSVVASFDVSFARSARVYRRSGTGCVGLSGATVRATGYNAHVHPARRRF